MTWRRIRRGFPVAISILLTVAGLAVTLLFFQTRRSIQSLDGAVRLQALDSLVTVHLDPLAIPHIFASTEADLAIAQGYLHASERLWQMELFRRIAEGRLAELFGEVALETDRFLRTVDLWGAAERSLRVVPRRERALLDAYAAGVNAKLERWTGPLPPEFRLLGIKPRPWDAHSSVAIAKMMTLDLSSWRTELARFRSATVVDPERRAYLELPYPEWGPTIIEDQDETAGLPAALSRATRGSGVLGPVVTGRATSRFLPAEVTGPGPFDYLGGLGFSASNGWAVAGIRSATGHPLLASDMHLPLRAPSTWYLNALHAETIDLHVAGLSIPGAPGVIVGYNREIAWAFSNGMVDDADFTIEAVNLDQSAYRSAGSWRPFDTRIEEIRVRGRSDPVRHTVRTTVRGPVISDVLANLGVTLSLLWTGHRPSSEVRGLWAMNRATDPDSFDLGVRAFTSPHQNVIYATAHGFLGYRLSGTVPRRDGWDGSRPIGFERLEDGWTSILAPDSMPATSNPPRGYLASANNLQARALYGVLGVDYPLPFRARRIVDRLSAETSWTVDGMRSLQLDSYSLLAEQLVGHAVAAARRVGETAVAEKLERWDLRAETPSEAAPLFYVWLYRLRQLIAEDELESVPEWEYFPDAALLRHLEQRGGPWVDDLRTETLETLGALEEAAIRTAIEVTEGRSWGEVHRERSLHPLGRLAWLDRVFGFDVGPVPARGARHTVRPDDPHRWAPLDSTSWRPPFVSEYGPSERFVADLRPGESVGYFLLPTGQSGNPASPHYRDMMERWAGGDLVPMPLDRGAVQARAVRTLQLRAR